MFKLEKVKITYVHEVDRETQKKMPLSRGASVMPNASLTEAVDEVGNPNRLSCQYVVGKKPETRQVRPHEVESLRPSKQEMKNG